MFILWAALIAALPTVIWLITRPPTGAESLETVADEYLRAARAGDAEQLTRLALPDHDSRDAIIEKIKLHGLDRSAPERVVYAPAANPDFVSITFVRASSDASFPSDTVWAVKRSSRWFITLGYSHHRVPGSMSPTQVP